MNYEFCKVERDGPITTIIINRPESMNSLHNAASIELENAFNDFAADPAQWVCILTGAGDRAFSAGNDLKTHAAGGNTRLAKTGFGGITARFDLNKPVIAAVNGIAMGGGFEMALASDILIASENAVFALSEPKVGLAALAGGLLRLPQQIGLKHAMGMILTGRKVSAQEGKALGFVNEVVPQGELMATAKRWAQDIAACSPMSVRAAKETVQKGLEEGSLEIAMKAQWKYPAIVAMFASDDAKEGPRAFAEKRKPNWKGV